MEQYLVTGMSCAACHIKSCVAEDIRAGNDEAIDDFVKMLQKLMK